MLTIEQKRKICDYLNGLEVLESDHEYIISRLPDFNLYELISLGANKESLIRYLEGDELDITKFAFENDYADLYSNEGFIVFDEKIAIGEFLVGRVGAKVQVGKFNGDIYESETLDQEQRFKLTMLLVMANYHA